jgi:hypothetical protein
MNHLECPSEEDWKRRREWCEALFDFECRPGHSYIVSEQALGLSIDLQAVYCCGAYVACIILACTMIDTHIRDAEIGPTFDGSIQAAFETSRYAQDLEWLRVRRNRLVHFKEAKGAAISVDMLYADRSVYEQEAQRAITLAADVMFENPGS